MTQVVLRRIERCTLEQQKAVRDVRNQPSIRKSMYTEHEIGLEEHLTWLEKLRNDSRQIVFIVLVDDVVSGIVSVNAIDELTKNLTGRFIWTKPFGAVLGLLLNARYSILSSMI